MLVILHASQENLAALFFASKTTAVSFPQEKASPIRSVPLLNLLHKIDVLLDGFSHFINHVRIFMFNLFRTDNSYLTAKAEHPTKKHMANSNIYLNLE